MSRYLKVAIPVLVIVCLIGTYLIFRIGKSDFGRKADGKINEVEMTSQESEKYEASNIFDGEEDPFGYAYESVEASKAFMKFPVPKEWTVTVNSSRDIRFDAPSDDKYFPGTTFRVLYIYDYVKNPFLSESDNFSTYESLFEDELPLLRYNLSGDDLVLRGYTKPESKVNGATFTKKENKVLFTKNTVELIDPSDKTPRGNDYSALYAYVDWEGIPALFSCVTTKDKESNAEQMLRYMVSNIKYTPQTFDSLETKTIGNVSLPSPSYFEPREDGENCLEAPASYMTASSGIVQGVFKVQDTNIDANKMTKVYGPQIASTFSDVADTQATATMEKIKPLQIGGRDATLYEGVVTAGYDESKQDNPTISMTSNMSTWYLSVFVVPDKKETTMIATWFQSAQKEAADKILDASERQISFR